MGTLGSELGLELALGFLGSQCPKRPKFDVSVSWGAPDEPVSGPKSPGQS